MIKNKSSVLQALFKRKGGEGAWVKIITLDNENRYKFLFDLLPDEEAIIGCYIDASDWFLLTNERVIDKKKSGIFIMHYSDLADVKPAFQNELSNGITNAKQFTKILLTNKEGFKHIFHVESGLPYEGVLQVLHFSLAS